MRRGWVDLAGSGVALLVFSCALLPVFHVYLGADLDREAPVAWDADRDPIENEQRLLETDHRFVIWLVGRNAWTLLHRPLALLDAEGCFPERRTLSLGEPGISLGIVGMPAWLATGDPVATYNLVVLALPLIAALSMFLLVRDWTGVPAAGIAAGLLFGFHHVKLWEVVHPYGFDNAWTALALFFAVRFCERQRWRDALGLGLAASMQLAGSLYPTFAAACIAPPLIAWLALRHGVRGQRPLRWLLVVAIVAGTAVVVFGPYLARRAEGVIVARDMQFFLDGRWLLPGGKVHPGFVLPALAVLGALLGLTRFRDGRARDPRWALVAGALVALAFAAGGGAYEWLAQRVPGLANIRFPWAIYSGAHLALCVLAGLGCARLVRAAPRGLAAGAVASLLVTAAFLDTLRPASLGFEPWLRYRMVERAPSRESIAFFRALHELGDEGPVAEAPLGDPGLRNRSQALLLSAYHHRRTWACLPSFRPPMTHRVVDLLRAAPHPGAVRELAELGFTTLVVYHERERPLGRALQRAFETLASAPDAPIERIHGTEEITAYALRDARALSPPAPGG
jgi:hypothetical protein